jgi:hypothetical protein
MMLDVEHFGNLVFLADCIIRGAIAHDGTRVSNQTGRRSEHEHLLIGRMFNR